MKSKNLIRSLLLLLALIALTLFVYRPVTKYDFVHYDDVDYLVKNPSIRAGLSFEGIRWAFTTPHALHYIPLAWISFMADVSRRGLDPGSFHTTNLILHAANVSLLLLVLFKLTGALWTSVLTAAVFAVHPLGVETVAWIYERKGLLSAFFSFLCLLAWIWYVRRPGLGRYLLVATSLLLALLSKPMALSLPALLFLLDWWPLGRLSGSRIGPPGPKRRAVWKSLVSEKIPLFLMGAVLGMVLLLVFRQGGFLVTPVSLGRQASNLLVSYPLYFWKTVWPRGLSIAYLIPAEGYPWWKVILAVASLTGLSLFAMASPGRRPSITAGWLWFLTVLFPAIGLLNTGSQAMADRHAYLALIGLYLGILWWAADVSRAIPRLRMGLGAGAAVLVFCLAAASMQQVPIWQNAETLFGHARAVTPDNWVAYHNLGVALEAEGKFDEAIRHYAEAVRIKPSLVKAQINLGALLAEQGRPDEAIIHYYQALQYEPLNVDANLNLGIDLTTLGRYEEAANHYRQVLRVRPDHAQARGNLSWLLSRTGR